ncbi:MAG: cysteine--tRNA ligase, partial [Clostridia bacterium]|nr:cysteine--tRNA ligase [Clostridia bacterium]
DSPWGVGYPGWHIECSTIAIENLGERLDIHCGGVDNIFPHHTNEIAQSEAYLGHKWCKYWFHSQHLNDEQGKMSKSRGEFLTLSLLIEKGYDPLAYRLFCLQSHYRKPLTFTFANLDNAQKTYDKLRQRISKIKKEGGIDRAAFDEYKKQFTENVANDMNTSLGLTALYDVIKSDLNGATKIELIEDFDRVLGLDLTAPYEPKEETPASDEDAEYIEAKIAERAEAKKTKNYALADAIRKELADRGIVLVDTPAGTTYHR